MHDETDDGTIWSVARIILEILFLLGIILSEFLEFREASLICKQNKGSVRLSWLAWLAWRGLPARPSVRLAVRSPGRPYPVVALAT